MNPSFIDTLAAGETWPSWLPYLFGGLFILACIASLLLYLKLKALDFRRDRDAATAVLIGDTPRCELHQVTAVGLMWGDRFAPQLPKHDLWVRVVSERQYDTALHEADDTVHQGMNIAGTISGPRHEFGSRWATRLLMGETDVYTVTVRDRADDPGGAQALVHELARHLWPHLKGYGWNREDGPHDAAHDGHADARSEAVARELGEVLR